MHRARRLLTLVVLGALVAGLPACEAGDEQRRLGPAPSEQLDPSASPEPPSSPPPAEARPPVSIEPASGSMAGYYPIAIDLSETALEPSSVEKVTVGDLNGIWLEPDGDALWVTVQGAPRPGPVDVVLSSPDTELVVEDSFTYAPPVDRRIMHIAGVGASISQGFQAGALDTPGMLGSPLAWVARQAGAYMPMPLLVDGLFEAMDPSMIGPLPACATPDVLEWMARAVGAMVPKLTMEGGGTSVALGRLDPELIPSNLALSGSVVTDTVYGPTGATAIMAQLAYAPEGPLFSPVESPSLDIVEQLQPDILIALDFYGNDVLLVPPLDDPLEQARVDAKLHADIIAAVDRMAEVAPVVFVSDIPRTSLLAEADLERALAAQDGRLDEKIAEFYGTDMRTLEANQVLYAAAAWHDNVHVLPLSAVIEGYFLDGLALEGATLGTGMYGGLVGIDGVHLTDTGNAVAANLIIEGINRVMGSRIPLVDLEAVFAHDPESPSALRAAGAEIDGCGLPPEGWPSRPVP